LAAAGGCHSSRPPDTPGAVEISGKGKLLALDQTLGMGTLDWNGHNVRFWWKNRAETPGAYSQTVRDRQGHTRTIGDPINPDADLPPPRVTFIPFNAQVGDTIVFRGFEQNGELYITGATALRK
jgi:hypothetical protein